MWCRVYRDFRYDKFFFFGITGVDTLMEEIFYLSYYLHWSKRDVLDLPILERRRYLELLSNQLQRERGQDDDE